MIKVRVVSVGMVADGEGNIVILKEVDGDRYMAIGVGLMEATSIALAVEGLQPPRPMTHDLLCSVIERLGASVVRSIIHDLRDDTFIGILELETDWGIMEVDARPSDCIAIAARTDAPLFVAEAVIDVVGSAAELSGGEGEEDVVH